MDLIEGERYIVAPGAHRANTDRSWISGQAGQTVTVIRGTPDGVGDVQVRSDGGSVAWVLPEYLIPIDAQVEGDTEEGEEAHNCTLDPRRVEALTLASEAMRQASDGIFSSTSVAAEELVTLATWLLGEEAA